MPPARRRVRAKLRPLAVMFVFIAALSACSRHNEDEISTLLTQWFALGDQTYFKSEFRCTAAVYTLRSTYPKAALRIETEMIRALFSLRRTGVLALSLANQSPDQVFISIMDADRAVGVPVQVAAVLSRDCMDLKTEGVFHAALSNPASLFVWHADEESIIIMDPLQKVAILASGVNW